MPATSGMAFKPQHHKNDPKSNINLWFQEFVSVQANCLVDSYALLLLS